MRDLGNESWDERPPLQSHTRLITPLFLEQNKRYYLIIKLVGWGLVIIARKLPREAAVQPNPASGGIEMFGLLIKVGERCRVGCASLLLLNCLSENDGGLAVAAAAVYNVTVNDR